MDIRKALGLARNSTIPPAPDPAVAELGRDYAIARRHKDRKAMTRIMRTVKKEHGGLTGTTKASFEAGQESYDSIPAITQPKRRRRR
ncbi:hypothetical protein D7231_35330 [Streptomyces klenkii]|uniref:Uncharacterized protein n=1 Tax=Streptomyces klenkii TaxID=1420899 RepID=A0A3A9ZVV6_9ACTN|nr:hypothetical protein [Streptomyces klenkii]RKN52309.1 hypothetical protein D7231_35330 [Streptomyces klenkii]